ncbi:MAG: hypothetical protein ACOVQK_07355, partial [Cyanobium sp.]
MDTSSVGKMTAGGAFGTSPEELKSTSLLPEPTHLNGSLSKERKKCTKKSALRRFALRIGATTLKGRFHVAEPLQGRRIFRG